MSFFRIIVPSYNNSEWLDRCINSITGQTFTDWSLVVVDDFSTDNSYMQAVELVGDKGLVIPCYEKVWNGGARNIGLKYYLESEYTLFLDSDDYFASLDVLQELHDFIVNKDYPACIRLPFSFEYDGDKIDTIMLDDDNAEKLVNSMFVSCWSKCIETELIQPFPENTLMEDAVQHIKQCDVIPYQVAVFNKPVVVYNRNNINSCSKKRNMNAQNQKWKSSMYRHMADLLDLELEHDYCKRQRDIRAARCLKNIKADKYIQ